jgi:hypothetical protein
MVILHILPEVIALQNAPLFVDEAIKRNLFSE